MYKYMYVYTDDMTIWSNSINQFSRLYLTTISKYPSKAFYI